MQPCTILAFIASVEVQVGGKIKGTMYGIKEHRTELIQLVQSITQPQQIVSNTRQMILTWLLYQVPKAEEQLK